MRTDLSERSERAGNTDRELYEQTLGPDGLAAIQRIRDRVLPGEGEPGVFLCHRFCELGATEITGALRSIREFLVERPDSVIVIVIEDYVLPSAIVAAFEESGLAEKVYRGPPAGPFPTLREMIDSGQQVVVYAENHGGAAPWYTAGYEQAMQETPFTFKRAVLLTTPSNWPSTCRANRGPDDAPLFLINHWVNTDPTPRPSDADKVNTRPVLVGRSRECERLRDLPPEPAGGRLLRPRRRGRRRGRAQRRRLSTSPRSASTSCASVSSAAVCVVVTAHTVMPAARAARTPAGASSITRQSAGSAPSAAAPAR